MSACVRFVIAAAALGVVALPNSQGSGVSAQTRGGARWLRVELEQDGQKVAIKNHEAALQRKPFDIIIYMPDKGGVAVRSASHSALYDLAKSDAPLGKIFNPSQTVPYTPFNKDEDMTLDDPTVQDSWWYDSAEKDHTFNGVTRTPDGFRCRRRISNFWLDRRDRPVADTDFDAIYLVFLTGKSTPDHYATVEEQRDYLKIAFVTPKGAAATAAAVTPSAARPKVFAIGLEQLGRPIDIRDHEARLRKAPFDAMIELKDTNGVYVHASFGPAVYDRARRGEPLGSVFAKGETIALSLFNEDQLLFLNDEESHQFWFYFTAREHAFNGVTKLPDGVRGRRVVTNLRIGDQQLALHRAKESVLYLVFYAGDLSDRGDVPAAQMQRERQRDYLKLLLQ